MILLDPVGNAVVIDVEWSCPGQGVSLYVLCGDDQRRVSAKDHVVWAGQPHLMGDAVVLRTASSDGDRSLAQAQVLLEDLPDGICGLELVLAASQANVVLNQVRDITVTAWDPATGESVRTSSIASPGIAKCVSLGVLARQDGRWRLTLQPTPFDGVIAQFVWSRFKGSD